MRILLAHNATMNLSTCEKIAFYINKLPYDILVREW